MNAGKARKSLKKTRDGLTALQIDFCLEYAINGYKNATSAYMRAARCYDNYQASAASASKLLKRERIQSYLARVKKKQEIAPYAVSKEEIQREVYDLVQVTTGRKPAPRLGYDLKTGTPFEAGDLRGIEPAQAIRALDVLAKMNGVYTKESGGNLQVNLNIDLGGSPPAAVIEGESSNVPD